MMSGMNWSLEVNKKLEVIVVYSLHREGELIDLDISETIRDLQIEPTSIEKLAEWRISKHKNIIYRHDVFWEEIKKGFFQPLYLLQRLHASQIHFMSAKNWGIRAAVSMQDEHQATGTLTYYTLENFKQIEFVRFSKNRRKNIRKCFREVEIKEIRDEKILFEQGYDIVKSSLERTRHRKHIPEKKEYQKGCASYINPGDNSRMVLGGFRDHQLLGFLELYAVRDTINLVNLLVSTEALKYCVSPGLYFTAYLLGKQTDSIKQFFAGLSNPLDKELCVFKESMGQTLKSIPIICKMAFPTGLLMRVASPYYYHRLRGEEPDGDTHLVAGVSSSIPMEEETSTE